MLDEYCALDFKNHNYFCEIRRKLVTNYSWAIPTEEAISLICKYSPIIEIGAGKGYWANLISSMGGDIIAFDKDANKTQAKYFDGEKFFPVKYGHSKTVTGFPDRSLFLCWPPYDMPMAYKTLKNYRGKTLIYIGEGHYGCTGCKLFHKEIDKNWEKIDDLYIPQWPGIGDRLVIYGRKSLN